MSYKEDEVWKYINYPSIQSQRSVVKLLEWKKVIEEEIQTLRIHYLTTSNRWAEPTVKFKVYELNNYLNRIHKRIKFLDSVRSHVKKAKIITKAKEQAKVETKVRNRTNQNVAEVMTNMINAMTRKNRAIALSQELRNGEVIEAEQNLQNLRAQSVPAQMPEPDEKTKEILRLIDEMMAKDPQLDKRTALTLVLQEIKKHGVRTEDFHTNQLIGYKVDVNSNPTSNEEILGELFSSSPTEEPKSGEAQSELPNEKEKQPNV